MRISVECGGFDDAADACRTANQTVALLTESLAGKLTGFAGMVGNDAASVEFATSYDAAAAEAVDSLSGLVHAFIGLGRLLSASSRNHAAAESAAAGRVLAYVGRGLSEDDFVRVSPAVAPSSLGTQEPSLGVVDRWILDQVEGFVWPGADVALLREAAHVWSRTASAVGALADHLRVAEGLVGRQRSPEVAAALAGLAEVRSLVGDVAAELAGLATACDDYAAAVEEVHARTRALLAEIAAMVVEGAAISLIVGGLTGGLGGSATAAAAAARVRTQAPRFHALLVGLRAGISISASRLRTARESLHGVRVRLDRYARVAVRDERGEMLLPGGWRTTVDAQETMGGHLVRKHLNRRVDELATRARKENLDFASSFKDAHSAEKHIAEALAQQTDKVAAWLDTGIRRLRLDAVLDDITGISVDAAGASHRVHGVRVVLVRDAASPSGYRILTAFPQP